MSTQTPIIDNFHGEHRFLSNFYAAEVEFEHITYPTLEHAYQAAKTTDYDERKRFAALPSPGNAKRAGRKIAIRPDWEAVRVGVMEALLREKFTRHAELRELLLATGDSVLVEGNTWGDRFWGVCGGEGQNRLGRLLMKLRDELRA